MGQLFWLGAVLLVEIALAVYLLVDIWPAVAQVPSIAIATAAKAATKSTASVGQVPQIQVFWYHWSNPSSDALYLIAVVLLGAIGASIAALTSFATFVGNRTFIRSWKWWYVVRMPIGAAIAVVFYFVLRGGLLSVSTTTGAISPYGIGAVAALAGMFSKQATDKLDEVFTNLFRTEGGDNARKDNADGTQPPTSQ